MKTAFLRIRGVTVTREIAPYALVAKSSTWNMVWAGRDTRLRVDRASAVIDAELLDEKFTRPEGFDLSAFWSRWVSTAEANRAVFSVVAIAKQDVISMLEREVGKGKLKHLIGQEPANRQRVELTFEFFAQARSILLSFGGAIEVLSPEALRRSMADFGEQIQSTYRDS